MSLNPAPLAWDGSPISAIGVSSVTIWCSVAPSVAPTIQKNADNSANWYAQTAVTSSFGLTSTITTTGPYIIPSGGYVQLSGGTGGTYAISGE